MHIYIPVWGSGVRIKTSIFGGQVSEIWISDNQGIYPSRLFYPSSSKLNKGTVIIIRSYGATQIYELPCRKLWIIANSQSKDGEGGCGGGGGVQVFGLCAELEGKKKA